MGRSVAASIFFLSARSSVIETPDRGGRKTYWAAERCNEINSRRPTAEQPDGIEPHRREGPGGMYSDFIRL